MEILTTKRLDHLGLVMGIMNDFGLIDFINERIPQKEQNNVSAGEAVAAMVINGLGFTNCPLSLTPQFFETKPLDILFEKEIHPEDLNRHRLGRVLDEIHEYGTELLFSEISLHVCKQLKLDRRFTSIDTTSFSVSGAYDEQTDEHTVTLTQGYSKDHRPDLKQIILELITTHDGGIPLMMKSFDGNASDNTIFKERCQALLSSFKEGDFPQIIVGDSKLYHEKNSDNLKQLKYITRIPGTYSLEQESILEALSNKQWTSIDEENEYYEKTVTHFDINQRWLVVMSKSAQNRAIKTITKQIEKEYKMAEKTIMHLRNKEFACAKDAEQSLEDLSKNFKYHDVILDQIICHDRYDGKGRPKKDEHPSTQVYQILAKIVCLPEKRMADISQRSCYVIGTNVASEELGALEIIEAYKNQNASIERGFRFLKDPYFFTSSFFLKKTSRIMGLLMVMTLSLLVYSVAQRHLRKELEENNETIPNQIKKPVKNPTMRWVFQLLGGIDVVYVKINDVVHRRIIGISELKAKILSFFSEHILRIYGLNPKIKEEG
jgi:transposase